jgi:hypothetical protein
MNNGKYGFGYDSGFGDGFGNDSYSGGGGGEENKYDEWTPCEKYGHAFEDGRCTDCGERAEQAGEDNGEKESAGRLNEYKSD